MLAAAARRLLARPPWLAASTYRPLPRHDDDEEADGDGDMSSAEHVHVSPADDARVLRRIDLALMPLLLAVYFLQAMDKATLSFASIFGLIEDTRLVGSQYSWLGSIVFLAQFLAQPFIALALVKLPVGYFTGAAVVCWGLSLAAMTLAHDFTTLMVARFLLGAFEATVGPAFLAITQQWWRRREQPLRIGSWYCMNGLTWVLGSLITYGLARIDSSLKPYQIIFLFFGLVTVAVGCVMLYSLPQSPSQARFLTDKDKLVAVARLRHNQAAVTSRQWTSHQFVEALLDLKTWLWLALIFCISVPSNGLSFFGPLIVKSFVSDPLHVMLFNIPVGLSHIVSVSASAYMSTKTKVKGPIISALCIPPLVGLAILHHFRHDVAHRAALLTGYFLISSFAGITPLIYSWSTQNTAGATKCRVTSAVVFIGSSAGNVVGPLLFKPDEAPAFSRGIRVNIGFFCAILFLTLTTMAHVHALNHRQGLRRIAMGKKGKVADLSLETAAEAERIERLETTHQDGEDAQLGPDGNHRDNAVGQRAKASLDATDRENEDFIYVW